MPDLKAVRVLVSGRVQGVGFRYSTCDEALRLGLAGWVRNLPSGGVEVLAQGAGADVDRLLVWLESGPRTASVSDLEMAPASPDESLITFTIRSYPQGF